MTKEQYKRSRRMIRDLADAQDWMAERADIVGWCKRAGVAVNARQTSRGYCAGVAA